MTFQGCEARFREPPPAQRPFSPCRPGVCDVAACDAAFEARARRWLDQLMRWADKAFCVNPDLLAATCPRRSSSPTSPFPPTLPEASAKARRGPPVIVHAPSNRSIKGTEFLLAASASLRVTHPHKLRLVEGLPRPGPGGV